MVQTGVSARRAGAGLLDQHEQLRPACAEPCPVCAPIEHLEPDRPAVVVDRASELGDGDVHRPRPCLSGDRRHRRRVTLRRIRLPAGSPVERGSSCTAPRGAAPQRCRRADTGARRDSTRSPPRRHRATNRRARTRPRGRASRTAGRGARSSPAESTGGRVRRTASYRRPTCFASTFSLPGGSCPRVDVQIAEAVDPPCDRCADERQVQRRNRPGRRTGG